MHSVGEHHQEISAHAQQWREENRIFSTAVSATLGVDQIDRRKYESKAAEVERTFDVLLQAYADLVDLQRLAGKEHNSRLTVNHLPPETLGAIFETCVDSFKLPLANDSERHREVISLSHVCSEWRSIALAFTGLWSVVNLSTIPSQLLGLFLDRAGEHPLRVEACNPFRLETIGHTDFLSSQLQRIKSLDVYEYNPPRPEGEHLSDVQPRLLNLLISESPSGPLLTLERLSWRVARYGRRNVSPEVLYLPIFGKQPPRLRHLVFHGTRMLWKRGFYSNLETLEMKEIDFGTVAWSDEDICNVLLDCPQLRTLKLGATVDKENSPISGHVLSSHLDRPNGIHLPQLRHLDLQVPLPYGTHIMQSITVEDVCQVQLRLHSPDMNANVADIVDTLRSNVLRLHADFSQPGLLSISYEWYPAVSKLWVSVWGHECSDGKDIHIRLEASFFASLDPVLSPAASLARILHRHSFASSVELLAELRLYIPINPEPGDTPYATHLPPCVLFPCKTLRLVGKAAACLFYQRAICGDPGAEDCPALERLHIERVEFWPTWKEVHWRSIIDWCRCQSSLRELTFETVYFALGSAEEWETLQREVEALGIKAVWRNCFWGLPEPWDDEYFF
ncbi:hypothetical protein PHLGIDRAFT_459196 [Phlebiopsis gigantea 11061_1 CR5-6]|uniref:Uncharacterized protein n=1 Tax=Phlebiopsis gigantea (strain 11061_1 CR5-6) TaxID=745531 RepID=A0A0C3S6X7_PHLG1|nr:hypothetical protein PHLGIDRAFT_459196 [Phlebiopsis gigantea 11061_1 CR5-6]